MSLPEDLWRWPGSRVETWGVTELCGEAEVTGQMARLVVGEVWDPVCG